MRERHHDTTGSRERDPLYQRNDVPTYNPLEIYLEQWITPQSLELLRTDHEITSFNESVRNNNVRKPTTGFASESRMAPDNNANLNAFPSDNDRFRNPYIDEIEGGGTPETTGLAPLGTKNLQPAQIIQPVDTSLSPVTGFAEDKRQITEKKQLNAKEIEDKRLPTTPIIDDRKYFPQLRRF